MPIDRKNSEQAEPTDRDSLLRIMALGARCNAGARLSAGQGSFGVAVKGLGLASDLPEGATASARCASRRKAGRPGRLLASSMLRDILSHPLNDIKFTPPCSARGESPRGKNGVKEVLAL